MKRIYDKLASEGGGTWATYMMIDIEEAFAAMSDQVGEPVAHICDGCGRLVKDADADMQQIRVDGFLSCCPERMMKPLYYTHPPAPAVGPDVREFVAYQKVGEFASSVYLSDNITPYKSVADLWRSAGAEVRELYALSRALGGDVVQEEAHATKQATDPEDGSRTETAGAADWCDMSDAPIDGTVIEAKQWNGVIRLVRWSQSAKGTSWHSGTSDRAYIITERLIEWRPAVQLNTDATSGRNPSLHTTSLNTSPAEGQHKNEGAE